MNNGFLTSSGCQQSHRDITCSLGAYTELDEGPIHARAASRQALAGADHQNGAGGWGRGTIQFASPDGVKLLPGGTQVEQLSSYHQLFQSFLAPI